MLSLTVRFKSYGTLAKRVEDDSDQVTFTVKPDISISNFKQHIKYSCCITGSLSLTKDGYQLDSHTTLEGNGITAENQLCVESCKPRRRCNSHYIHVEISNANIEPIRLNIPFNADRCVLEHMVQDKCGMPTEEQKWYDGDVLLKTKNSFARAIRNRHNHLKVKWSPKRQTAAGINLHSSGADKSVEAQTGTSQCFLLKKHFTLHFLHLSTATSACEIATHSTISPDEICKLKRYN